jgi:uncharacterized membrane protein
MARWTLKQVIQGKSIKRPTHPIIVFFPIAFMCGALMFDILSLIGLQGMVKGSTVIVAAAAVTAGLAIIPGLLDRSDMRPGSPIHRVATRHMYIQSVATALFVANFILHWADHNASKATVAMIAMDVLAATAVIIGGDVGVQMVFRYGAKVSAREPSFERPAAQPDAPTQSSTAPPDK